MPRYIKQRDKFRCGPVAVMNALKWAGEDVSYVADRDRLDKLCNCGPPPSGTNHPGFDRALRAAGKGIYSVRKVRYPTLREIEEHLQNGHAVVFNYYWRDEEEGTSARHFEFLVGVSPSGKSIYVVNGSNCWTTLHRVTRERFKKEELRFQRVDPRYTAWFLKKKE